MTDDEAPIDVLGSAGALDPVVLMLREYLHRSGALRAVAVVDRAGEGDGAILDCERLQPIAVEERGRSYVIPHAIELDAESLPVPDVRQMPPFDVTPATGEVAGPIGGFEMIAASVRALAEAIGGQSIVLATFPTTTPDAPLSVSARVGEALLITIGEDEFEMDAGWPPRK